MGMNCPGQIMDGTLKLQSGNRLGDQVRRLGGNDVHAKDFTIHFIRDNFDKTRPEPVF